VRLASKPHHTVDQINPGAVKIPHSLRSGAQNSRDNPLQLSFRDPFFTIRLIAGAWKGREIFGLISPKYNLVLYSRISPRAHGCIF